MDRRSFLAALPPLLAGCAPLVQSRREPPTDFTGPRLEEAAFVSFDGTRLPMNVWPAQPEGEPWAVIAGLHGMNDYAEAFTLAAPVWAQTGIATYAYDQRGFGRGPNRGVWAGRELMAEDLRTFTSVLRRRHPNAVLSVVGESMGGAVAIAAFSSSRPPDADRLALIAPAVWGWDSQPVHYRTTLWLGARTVGGLEVSAPRSVMKRIRASDNIEHLIRMGRDRNLIFRTRIDAIYGLVDLMQTAMISVGRIRRPPPVLYCYGRNDEIIPEKPSFVAARQLRPGDRSAYYEAGWHMLTRDLQGEAVSRDIAAFIADAGAALPSGAPPIPAAPRSL